MLTRILPVCLFLSFQLIALHSATAQSLKGKWQGTSEGEVGKMTFDKKGYVSFIIDGKPMGGKKFSSEGADLTMRYEYNEKADPHTLDLIITLSDGSMELARMKGIYQFVDDKTLVLNMDFEGNARPKAFNKEDKNQVTLTRIK
jgi:uncharacterized protein (TIGR03067 family)